MLVIFEVENFRSIREPVVLNLASLDDSLDSDDSQKYQIDTILKRAAIYGKNASGKSNILAALAWLFSAVSESLRYWDAEIPIIPFRLQGDFPSRFRLQVAVNGSLMEYSVTLDSERVHSEKLSQIDNGNTKIIFDRNSNDIELTNGKSSFGVKELLTPTSLALTILNRLKDPIVTEFCQVFRYSKFINVRPYPRKWPRFPSSIYLTSGRQYILDLFDEENSDNLIQTKYRIDRELEREEVRDLLLMADLGVTDLEVKEVDRYVSSNLPDSPPITRKDIQLIHQGEDSNFSLPFDLESQGTHEWFRIIGTILPALRNGSLVVIDELDSSLHPLLCERLLELFTMPEINPRNAQLVFSAHDEYLMNQLRRDEIWFTDKSSDGSTELYPLSEFQPSQLDLINNIGSAYLMGRFGGVPEINSIESLLERGSRS